MKWLGTDHWLLPDGRHLLLCKARVLGVGPGTFADFTGQTDHAFIFGVSTSYATASSTSTSFSSGPTAATIRIGQDKVSTNYYVYRGYLSFDTSDIPDDATISDVKLYMWVSGDNSATDFTVEIYKFDWSSPVASGNQEANFDASGAAFDQHWQNTSDISVTEWYANSTSLDANWVSKTGVTRYMLKSSRDVDGDTPSGSERISVASPEYTDYKPYLAITYSEPVTKSQQFQWALRNAVSDVQEIAWQLRITTSDAQQFQWTLGNSLVKDQQLQWALYNQATDVQQFQWDLKTQVAGAQILAYAIRNAMSDAQQFQWDIGAAVSKAQTLSWLIGGVVSQTQQFQWDLTGDLAKAQTFRWALFSLAPIIVLGMPDVAIGLDLPDRTPVLGMPDVAIEVEME